MNRPNFRALAWPNDNEEDAYDRMTQQHNECGCEGINEPCECLDQCALCQEVKDGIAWVERYNAKYHKI